MNKFISIYMYKNEKRLVATFPCSRAPEPRSQGWGRWRGGPLPRPGKPGQGGTPGCTKMLLVTLFHSYLYLYPYICSCIYFNPLLSAALEGSYSMLKAAL